MPRPDTQAGDVVKVLQFAGGRQFSADPCFGRALDPGHLEPSGPCNSVMAVELLYDGSIRDATSWEVHMQGADLDIREKRIEFDHAMYRKET